MSENRVTFQHAEYFVILVLKFFGNEMPIRNVYPNMHMAWAGDHLNLYRAGSDNIAATYHRSMVLLAEQWGQERPQQPRQIPPTTGGHPTDAERMAPAVKPAIPGVEHTQVIPTVQPTSVPESPVERMQNIVQKMSEEAVHAGATAAHDAEGTRGLRPAAGRGNREAGHTADRREAEGSAQEVTRDFPEGSISETQKVSGWQFLKQYLFQKNDEDIDPVLIPRTKPRPKPGKQEIVLGRERFGTHRRSPALHRKSSVQNILGTVAMQRYRRRVKNFAIRTLSRPRVRASFLAFVMLLAPTPIYIDK